GQPGIPRGGVPSSYPATEPRESPEPRRGWTHSGDGAGVVARGRSRGGRGGGVALEARRTVRPHARAAQATPRADGGAHRASAGADQDARGVRGSRARAGARGPETADRDAPPGE